MGKYVQKMKVIPVTFCLLIRHQTQKIIKVNVEEVIKAHPRSTTV